MSSTFTRTATQTTTVAKIAYVTRKVQADFLAILETYDYFTESYAQKIISDVRHLLDEEVLTSVEFHWKQSGTSRVLDVFRYVVTADGANLANDRSGGIAYRPELAGADFNILLTYNSRWTAMSQSEREAVEEELKLNWGAAGYLDYSGGRWVDERTYSKDGYGLVRRCFVR